MATIATDVLWGSGPKIYFDFSYSKQRSGTTQQYKITISCDPITGTSYYGYPIYIDISLDGTKKVAKYEFKAASPSQWSSTKTYTTGWLSVANKVTGTTALAIRIYSGSGSSRDSLYSYTLPIDAAPSTVAATDAYIGSSSTITINRNSSSFTHTLKYKADGQDSYTTIASKYTGSSYGWTVPTSLYSLIPSGKEISVTISCETFSGSTSLGTKTCTMTASTKESECAPTVSVAAEETDSNIISLTGSSKKLVKGYGSLAVDTTAAAQNKASISSISVTCGTDKKSGSSVTFTGPTSSTVKATATDSRGYSTTKTASGLSIVNYIELTANVTIERPSPTGDTVNITVEGNFFNSTFGSITNALTAEVRYKPKSQSDYTDADEYQSMTVTTSGNTYTATISLTGMTYTQAYSLRVRVSDKLHYYNSPIAEPIYRNTEIKKGIPVFDWGENDFNFNVPVSISGCGVYPGDEWMTLPLESGFEAYDTASTPVYRKVGNLVEISGTVKPTSAISGSATKYTISQLPEGYRPKTPIGILCQGSSTGFWFFHVSSGGVASFSHYRDENGYKDISTSTWLCFHCMFFVA